MKMVDGEFLKAAKEVAEDFPQIKFESMIVDATCMNLTLHPQSFDVMLLPNLYGSIIGSIVSGLVGGPGVCPGTNIGHNNAIFEQGARHTAEDLVEANTANPTGLILSSVMMLRHLKLPHFAEILQSAVFQTIKDQKVRTPDMGGHNTMDEYATEIINNGKRIADFRR